MARESYAAFRKLPAVEYGIYDCPTYVFQRKPFGPDSLLNFDSPVHELLPGMRDLLPSEKPVDLPVARTFQTMMIEPATYLPAVVKAHAQAGGAIVIRALHSLADVQALPERTIVNCTGLGAATLFDDKEMYPIKGQLTILRPQPEVALRCIGAAESKFTVPRDVCRRARTAASSVPAPSNASVAVDSSYAGGLRCPIADPSSGYGGGLRMRRPQR